jgi:linoleate 10R-lipoxygenase
MYVLSLVRRLTRGFDGKFDDDELMNVLLEATESPASAFRARGTAAVFRSSEILAIEQARFWGVCSLNEFRAHLGLKRMYISSRLSITADFR